ncbi:cupin domain-containing protein [Phytoactinopolyspora alkaliphila]|uniref:Cupin domain-containing protein n=1 Tax=Phytoactinopolyspora alkaliphila TaxID=1783498 RepID=A0A6N9YIK0_9ACTN|nr:cupin domain-containing protein [Phytoactinopolyspora alkaliphila]NED94740.1 cupin domain-containing protein [Phytoactinopolyspora alkaliphila]
MSDEHTRDAGPEPYVVDIEQATLSNSTFRTALWTGEHLQMTVMSIPVGGEVGLEMHDDRDQFLRLEAGRARVQMGPAKDDLSFDREVEADWVILVPASSWHNVTNIGDEPLKLYSLYAPPEHPKDTLHQTKAESDAAEHEH